MKLVSLFCGAGGLDRGFEQAGFETIWANDNDKHVWATYEANFPYAHLSTRSITDKSASNIPDCDGIIGGPPCQSWSSAGALRGINDKRGQLFFDYIRILKAKQPKFFLAENVSGMLSKKNEEALKQIVSELTQCGYTVSVALLNAADYQVPQDRNRIFFVGFRKDLSICYRYPQPIQIKTTLKSAIFDLADNVGEYCTDSYSSRFMSRNRVRGWYEQSYTIPATAKQVPIHPQAPAMLVVEKDKAIFVPGKEHLYRRLTYQECARIQTFPNDHAFLAKNIRHKYKLIGNAVPCRLAYHLATSIKKHL